MLFNFTLEYNMAIFRYHLTKFTAIKLMYRKWLLGTVECAVTLNTNGVRRVKVSVVGT